MLKKQRYIMILLILPLLLGAALLPLRRLRADAPAHTMDDALLLMIAAQSRAYDNYAADAEAHATGRFLGKPAVQGGAPRVGATPQEVNEQQALADYYRRYARTQPSGSPARQYFEEKADYHQNQVNELNKARRRYLRNRGLQGAFRNVIVKPIEKVAGGLNNFGRFVSRGMHKIGKLVVIIARDQLLISIKDVIREKITDLTNLTRGRLDAILVRIAKKVGVPVAIVVDELWLQPAFRRVQQGIDRRLNQLMGERPSTTNSDEEAGDAEDSADETGDDEDRDGESSGGEEHETDWDSVDEEGETTGYDDEDASDDEPAEEDEEPPPTEEDEEQEEEEQEEEEEPIVFQIEDWFSESDCRRFNGQMPSWMESTAATVSPWWGNLYLNCNFTTNLSPSPYDCDAKGEHCAPYPGRVTIEIMAYQTIADAQEAFRNHTTNCNQDPNCFADLTRLTTTYAEPEIAYGNEPAYFTKLIEINDNVVFELWWGGAQNEFDIYGILSTANALVDPLQR